MKNKVLLITASTIGVVAIVNIVAPTLQHGGSANAPKCKTCSNAASTASHQVIKIVAEQVGKSSETILMSDTLESLGADSLDAVEILLAVEKEFGIEIPDYEAEKLTTVESLINYVNKWIAVTS